jgi:hypothetical protein
MLSEANSFASEWISAAETFLFTYRLKPSPVVDVLRELMHPNGLKQKK